MSSKKAASLKADEDLNEDMSIQTSLGPNDVLLGRGTWPNETPGNVKFRALIKDTILECDMKTGDGKSRTQVARHIILAVKERGGKFLEKAEGYTFKVVSDAVALDKTKQSLRRQIRILGKDSSRSSSSSNIAQHAGYTEENIASDSTNRNEESHTLSASAAARLSLASSFGYTTQGSSQSSSASGSEAALKAKNSVDQGRGQPSLWPFLPTAHQQHALFRGPAASTAGSSSLSAEASSGILAVLAARCRQTQELPPVPQHRVEEPPEAQRLALDNALSLINNLIELSQPPPTSHPPLPEATRMLAASLAAAAAAQSNVQVARSQYQQQHPPQQQQQNQTALNANELYEKLTPFLLSGQSQQLFNPPPAPAPRPLFAEQLAAFRRNGSSSDDEDTLSGNINRRHY